MFSLPVWLMSSRIAVKAEDETVIETDDSATTTQSRCPQYSAPCTCQQGSFSSCQLRCYCRQDNGEDISTGIDLDNCVPNENGFVRIWKVGRYSLECTHKPPSGSCSVGEHVLCSDGYTFCSGNQCCPDGAACPSAEPDFSGCPVAEGERCTRT